MNKKILWLVAAIEDIGGGERLLFEGLNYYKNNNVDVQVVTWRYNKKAFFDDSYSFDNIKVIKSNNEKRSNIFKFALNRAKSIYQLYKIAKEYNPDLILCQSEYDAIFAGFIAKLLRKPYSVLIFGQTYQFPWDTMKYTFLFKKHLKEIVGSCQGYKDSIPLVAPKSSFINKAMMEVLSVLRFYFIKNATHTYTLSSQVQWEVKKIYNILPDVLRAGFKNETLDFRKQLYKNKTNDSKIKFVMLSRLAKKKRTDIAIKAFSALTIDAELVIMGGGEEFENLKKLVNDLKLNDKVTLTGRVSDKILEANLAKADVFISMDVGDFDITVVEAMSFGLYILVSTDFVIDDDFKKYIAINSVKPDSISLSEKINNDFKLYKTIRPNFTALNNLTWENYFNKIIKDNK
jgi:glycosyltransferase involved in cell wall biosynthesis